MKPRHTKFQLARPQSGVTIVESLVALVVLSVGLLGIASLYVISLQSGRTALIRTQAVTLVTDMADRVRANARARGEYHLAKYAAGPAEQDCVITKNCTAALLAQDDLARWLDAVEASLPNPDADVEFTAAAATGRPDRFRISVEWEEPGDTYSYETNLFMIPVSP